MQNKYVQFNIRAFLKFQFHAYHRNIDGKKTVKIVAEELRSVRNQVPVGNLAGTTPAWSFARSTSFLFNFPAPRGLFPLPLSALTD